MLPKAARLQSSQVAAVFLDSERVVVDGVVALWRPSHYSQVAVVAPKKTFKHATERNVVRRRTYNLLHHLTLPQVEMVLLVSTPHPTQETLSSLLTTITKRRETLSVLES